MFKTSVKTFQDYKDYREGLSSAEYNDIEDLTDAGNKYLIDDNLLDDYLYRANMILVEYTLKIPKTLVTYEASREACEELVAPIFDKIQQEYENLGVADTHDFYLRVPLFNLISFTEGLKFYVESKSLRVSSDQGMLKINTGLYSVYVFVNKLCLRDNDTTISFISKHISKIFLSAFSLILKSPDLNSLVALASAYFNMVLVHPEFLKADTLKTLTEKSSQRFIKALDFYQYFISHDALDSLFQKLAPVLFSSDASYGEFCDYYNQLSPVEKVAFMRFAFEYNFTKKISSHNHYYERPWLELPEMTYSDLSLDQANLTKNKFLALIRSREVKRLSEESHFMNTLYSALDKLSTLQPFLYEQFAPLFSIKSDFDDDIIDYFAYLLANDKLRIVDDRLLSCEIRYDGSIKLIYFVFGENSRCIHFGSRYAIDNEAYRFYIDRGNSTASSHQASQTSTDHP